jgi:hypothetical protein
VFLALNILVRVGFMELSLTPYAVLMLVLSLMIAYAIAKMFGKLLKSQRTWSPMLVGTLLGYLLTTYFICLAQAIIDQFGEYEIGLVETSIISTIGSLSGTYVGYRLAFVVSILF